MIVLGLCACRSPELPLKETPSSPSVATANPELLNTLKTDIAQTSAWLGTLTPLPTSTSVRLPVLAAESVTGTPMTQRNGSCPVPETFVVHQRDGFCVAAPQSWIALNIDGGLAAFLNTTPGQAISLQPDWAETTAICHLMIFIAAERDLATYLMSRHAEFGSRTDLRALSEVGAQTLGVIGFYGFTWEDLSGNAGGVYVWSVGPSHILNVTNGGSDCAVDRLIPVLDTLRVN